MHNVNTPNRNSYSKQPTDLSLFTKAQASDWYRSNQNKISNLRNVFFWCWAVVVIDGVLFSSANRRVIWFQATFSNRIQENYLLNRFKARFAFSMSFFSVQLYENSITKSTHKMKWCESAGENFDVLLWIGGNIRDGRGCRGSVSWIRDYCLRNTLLYEVYTLQSLTNAYAIA